MKRSGLVKKSKQTGIPYGILKKSYDRGIRMENWTRPGTTPQQWAFARVNSMLTGGKADPDLQKPKVCRRKKHPQEQHQKIDRRVLPKNVQEWFESNETRSILSVTTRR